MSYFKSKDTSLYYEIYEGELPVLLLHGWGIDHNFLAGCMEPIFMQFPNKFKRIYIDLPGMGRSTPGSIKNGDDIVTLLIEFLKANEITKPVLLVGNSFGGLLSLAIARKIPQQVSGCILIAPATGIKNRTLPNKCIVKQENGLKERLSREEWENFSAFNTVLTSDVWEQYKKYVYPAVVQNEHNDYLDHVLDGTVACDLYNKKENQQFDRLILVLAGKQDASVGYEDPYELSNCYPSSTYLSIHGAGHNLPYDQPIVFNGIVSSFLTQF